MIRAERVRSVAVVLLLCVAAVGCGGAGGSEPSPQRKAENSRASAQAAAEAAAKRRQVRAADWPIGGEITSRKRVPILMYHVIGNPPPDHPYTDLFVSKEQFAEQMRGFREAGFKAVTVDQAYAAWHGGPPLPKRPFVVSLDDGYSGWPQVLPIMRRYGWPGILNLKVDSVGTEISDAKVRRFIAAGWEINSHSTTHPDLPTVDDTRLRKELADSRRALQRRFGVPVNFFCYPSGKFDDRVVAAVEAAGYRGAITTEHGAARPNDPFRMPRVRVDRGDSASTLLDRVASTRW